jgi:predicted alpha-1,2-mannosidase
VRRLLFSSLLLLAHCSNTSSGADEPAKPAAPPAVTEVSPFVGSGGFAYNFGSAFAGALAPQGLAKVGPDTSGPFGTANFQHFSGYYYKDDQIQAFSHLHLHGTGATDYGVLSFFPTDGADEAFRTGDGRASVFRKETEEAHPGYYAVTLDRWNIRAEMTATPHAAHHRYSYPSTVKSPTVIVDLTHHLSGGTVTGVEATIDAATASFRGKLRSVGGMSRGFGGYDVFFEARASRPWSSASAWPGDGATLSASALGEKDTAGLALAFAPSPDPVELIVGLSLVSAEGAKANLDAEIKKFAFEETRSQTESEWGTLLDAIKIEGGSENDRRTFYTALYHGYMMPTRTGDASGQYLGTDGQIAQADGFHYCSDMSLWDTYRTLHPLYALVSPDRDIDAIRSLHAMAKASGFFPKWPIATAEAGTMIGASAEVVLADAYVKGVTGFDAKGAYEILRAAAMNQADPPGGRGGRDDAVSYMQYGYVPASRGGSVSKTVEYAWNDFALSNLARALGETADADALAARATAYRALFDADHGFLRARKEDGSWSTPGYSPEAFTDDYVEANGWHTVFGPGHDVAGLAQLFGGNEQLAARLDEFFTAGRQDYEDNPPDETLKGGGTRPHYWASNEPTLHTMYLFGQIGRPDLTQKWVRWVREFFFRPTPDGIPGNDDSGTMSAWYVFSALGFYPLAGSDLYFIGAPLFERAELRLPAGGTFVIEAPGVSSTSMYVQSVELNGAPLAVPSLHHADLRAGGSLRFVMGPTPGSWGK